MCAWFGRKLVGKLGFFVQASLFRPLLKVLNFWINIASLALRKKESLLLTFLSTWPLKSATLRPCRVKCSPEGSVWTSRLGYSLCSAIRSLNFLVVIPIYSHFSHPSTPLWVFFLSLFILLTGFSLELHNILLRFLGCLRADIAYLALRMKGSLLLTFS